MFGEGFAFLMINNFAVIYVLNLRLQRRPLFGGCRNLARAGISACFRIQDDFEPGKRALVVFTHTAHITYPGRKIRHGDQFTADPSVIYDMLHIDMSGMAFWARIARFFIGGFITHRLFLKPELPA